VDNPQNVISFCTGYGGLELGIGRAGVDVRIVCNVEIEAFVQANLVAKTEEGRMDNAPIWTDLKTFPASIFRGKVRGIIGGYPCQPFSSAGKRKGEEDPSHLWPYIRKHVRAVRPLWCFFENVQGHATMGLWRVLSDLEEEGYETTWGIFSAEEAGAPHQRKRVFILAKLPNTDCFRGEVSDQGKFPAKSLLNSNGEERGTKLGNSTSERPHRGSENCEGEQSEVLGERLESDELANPANLRREQTQRQGRQNFRRGSKDRGWHTREGQDTGGGSEEELGDTAGEGLEGRARESVQGGSEGLASADGGSPATRWPARPGEEQYEWEEPRVTEAQSELGGESHARQGHDGVDATPKGVDAIVNRVDRLRLLGNGVVPACAELAWRTLWKELNEKERN